jgi:hypothetical protein
MLSAVYLEHGLLAAIGVHYAWNVLTRIMVEMLSWQGGTHALEGAWTTTLILLVATAAIITVSRRRKLPCQIQGGSDAHDVGLGEEIGESSRR